MEDGAVDVTNLDKNWAFGVKRSVGYSVKGSRRSSSNKRRLFTMPGSANISISGNRTQPLNISFMNSWKQLKRVRKLVV